MFRADRARALFEFLAAVGFVLMSYRAATGTQPGTFPGEPWPCEHADEAAQDQTNNETRPEG